MINTKSKISIRRQSELLSVNRSSLYSDFKDNNHDLELCNIIAEIYSNYPIYGYRRITAMLQRRGIIVNHKKVLRLMKQMNIKAIYPGPNISKRAIHEMIYPYLLSDIVISKPNQVWQVDITYLRTCNGFMYLTALIDIHTRMVMGWNISNSLCAQNCILVLEDAIGKHGSPEILNSDQGSQFTSDNWINILKSHNIKISMTGKGRCNDNANIERLWRSFKYEGSYLYKWNTVAELKLNIPKWIYWYNNQRPHQALCYKTPIEKYYEFIDKSNDLPTISQYQLHNHDLFYEVV